MHVIQYLHEINYMALILGMDGTDCVFSGGLMHPCSTSEHAWPHWGYPCPWEMVLCIVVPGSKN